MDCLETALIAKNMNTISIWFNGTRKAFQDVDVDLKKRCGFNRFFGKAPQINSTQE